MAKERQHVEIVAELKPGADPAPVARWFEERGLDTLPLVVGVLVTGDADALRAALRAEPTGTLPIPDELAEHVASIAVVPPKEMHDRG
jgi:hypothetical protein